MPVAAVAVAPHPQIGLSKHIGTACGIQIKEMGQFHPVAHWKGDSFQERAFGGIFAGQGLDQPGKMGKKERKQGPDKDLRQPSTSYNFV